LSEYLKELISKYQNRGILIDANLLILYLVGEFAPRQIPRLRRTKKFLEADYFTVKAFFELFPIKVTTPNILTEISNLAGDMPDGLKFDFFEILQSQFSLLHEHYIPSKEGCLNPIFLKLGLTDSIIGQLARDNYLVLTDDFPLSNTLNSIGVDAINFNHLRFLDG